LVVLVVVFAVSVMARAYAADFGGRQRLFGWKIEPNRVEQGVLVTP